MTDCITFPKSPAEILKRQVDVSGRLDTHQGSGLVTSVSAPVIDPPGELVIAGAAATSVETEGRDRRKISAGKAIEFTMSAGNAGTRYEVKIPYDTDKGEHAVAEFYVDVK